MLLLSSEEKFELELIDGHLLIRVDGKRALIDTGSPVSLGFVSEFDFLGKSWPLQSSMAGVSFDEICGLLGFQVDVLIGMDLLVNYHMVIRSRLREITFSSTTPAVDGASTELDYCMSVPVVPVEINGQSRKAFFDTGAKLCYFDEDAVGAFSVERTVADFYPGFGAFETPVRNVPITVSGRIFVQETGTLPELLQASLLMTGGVEGIVGTPLLGHCDACLSFPENRMTLIAPESAPQSD